MQVILLKDNEKLGKKNSVVEVADVYARNVLLPKKLAVQATNINLARLEHTLRIEKESLNKKIKETEELKDSLKKLNKLIIYKKYYKTSIKEEKMFGSVTREDVSKELQIHNLNIDKKNIIFTEIMNEFKTYNIIIKLFNISVPLIIDIKKLKE